MKADDIRLFFEKENTKLINFVSDLILKSNIGNMKSIEKFDDKDNSIKIVFNSIQAIPEEDLIFNKLSNIRCNPFNIEGYIYFNSFSISIVYYTKINGVYFSIGEKIIKHKIKKYQIYNKYNNINITNNYFNEIYKVMENMKDIIINTKINKNTIIDFINLSAYNKKLKKSNIDFINRLPNELLKSSDIAYIIINSSYSDIPIRDFIDVFFNKVFIKSVPVDLLNYDYKSIIYDGIFDDKIVKKINAFDKQCEILKEVL